MVVREAVFLVLAWLPNEEKKMFGRWDFGLCFGEIWERNDLWVTPKLISNDNFLAPDG